MRTTTRTREYREGWLGRRRTYLCRICDSKFRVDTLKPLPEKQRICPICSEAAAIRKAVNAISEKLCPLCKEELKKLDWNLSSYLYLCDNVKCERYHRPAGVESKAKRPWWDTSEPEADAEPLPKVETKVKAKRKGDAKPRRKRGGKRKYTRQGMVFPPMEDITLVDSVKGIREVRDANSDS